MDLVSLITSTTSKGNPNAWDISKAVISGPNAWNISTGSTAWTAHSVAAQETTPTSLFFKPDGTKMYVLGDIGNDVNEYSLSSPWLVSSASYVNAFSVSTQADDPQGLFFKSDGTKMYVVERATDTVYQYSLSSAWDISTASYDTVSFSVAAQEVSPNGLSFKPDGTKMYVTGNTGDDVNEYNLSTPWDISTASYVQNFSVAAQESFPQDLFFKPDGTKMYIIGSAGDEINEYDLSAAWDVSSASYVQNFSVSAVDTAPTGLFFSPDGCSLYVLGSTNDTVYQFQVGGFDVAAQESGASGVFFKPDGTKMYVIGNSGDDVNEYDLSIGWDVSTATYLQNFSVAGQETEPRDIFFKPDGTKMYVIGDTGNDVNEYDLSTPWDISTASYLQNFSINAQETTPTAFYFSPDGFKMYVIGTAGDDVNEYTLGTAWAVNTATYVQNFSVAGQDTNPTGLFFKPDGTIMYVTGNSGSDFLEYYLSTPWDVSTASYVQNFYKGGLGNTTKGLFWKDDGTQFWFIDATVTAKIYTCLISEEQ